MELEIEEILQLYESIGKDIALLRKSAPLVVARTSGARNLSMVGAAAKRIRKAAINMKAQATVLRRHAAITRKEIYPGKYKKGHVVWPPKKEQ